MRTKISKLSELSDILVEKDRLDSGILNFVRLFKVGNLSKSFSALKEQGYPLLVIITKLILIRLGGSSVYAGMKTGPVPIGR